MENVFFVYLISLLNCMGKIVVPEIKENYSFYTDLLVKRKSIIDNVIDISYRANNAHYITSKNIPVKHKTIDDEIVFISEVKVRNYKYFHFKLKCQSLSPTPFFRYDSDGDTHRNYDENIPLSEQMITTPHFHNFNSDGLSLAYKTPQLMNEESCKALEDIGFCVTHFFHEGNIRLNKDDFPEIFILSKTLGLPQVEIDPNAGVNFI